MYNGGYPGKLWNYPNLLARGLGNFVEPAPDVAVADLLKTRNLAQLVRKPPVDIWFNHRIPNDQFESLSQSFTRIYAANVRIIEGIAREHGIKPMFYWQPTIPSKQQLSPIERRLVTLEPFILGSYKPMFLRANELVREKLSTDPNFADISGLFDDVQGTVYVDNEHYTEAASLRIAERILKDVSPVVAKLAKRQTLPQHFRRGP